MTAEASILHVDMDAFYASVAIRDRPHLRDVPVIVGGGSRGVVLSANYAARRHGVRSGIPMTRARRYSPDATVISPEFSEFSAVSAAVMETFRSITPLVEAMSLDEAYLDVAGARRRLGSPAQIAETIRAWIADEQGITCSVGVSTTTEVAKMASRRAKPDGVVVVPGPEVVAFLHPLDLEEMLGLGPKTAEVLRRLGLRTIGDLAHTPVDLLRRALGPAAGAGLHRLAWGDGRRTVTERRETEDPERSMGHDETFHRDTDDPEVVRRELLRLSDKLARRMRTARVAGRTVTLGVRFADFTTITRSRTLRDATDVSAEVYATACELFAALGLQRARIRRVGVRVEGLIPVERATRQLVLGQRDRGRPEAERAADRAIDRFGRAAVRPARLL